MILSTSCLSEFRTTTKTLVFPILRSALCALRFYRAPTDSIIQTNQSSCGFLFFGRLEIQDPRPDHDEVRHGAVDAGTSLRDIVQPALGEYLERVRRED